MSEITMKATAAATSTPSARNHDRGATNPNCAGRTGPTWAARNSAAATKPRSWITVAMSVAAGVMLAAARGGAALHRQHRDDTADDAGNQADDERGGAVPGRPVLLAGVRHAATGPSSSSVAITRDAGRGLAVALALAADPHRLDPSRAGARDVLLETVADVDRLARLRARERQRSGEQLAGGLRRPHLGRGRDAVEALAQASPLEHIVERDVPVARDDEAQAAFAPARERRGDLGEGREAEAVEQRRQQLARAERLRAAAQLRRDDARALQAQLEQALRIGGAHAVGAVVAHLGAQRAPAVFGGDFDAVALAHQRLQRRQGRLQLEQGPERVEEDRAARHRRDHCRARGPSARNAAGRSEGCAKIGCVRARHDPRRSSVVDRVSARHRVGEADR